jgi:hypothetical protein
MTRDDLTELARWVEISIAYLSRIPLDDLFAAARCLPPDCSRASTM